MANFSFDYGNAHWTVLDANATVDWTTASYRSGLPTDLAAAKAATWRFVSFHQPGFNSSKISLRRTVHADPAPVFEAGKVDVVFNGHVHNYQRSYPLRFVPDRAESTPPAGGDEQRPRTDRRDGMSTAKLTLDKSFDGHTDTSPTA